MSDRSSIEWTDATWPVVQGCDPVSPGCANCYAIKVVHRLAWNSNPKISAPLEGVVEYHKDALRWTGKVALREDRLDWPLKWKKGRMIFVPSHGDIFHKDVPDEFLDRIFAVMALCPQHVFQVLTKRPMRMREYMSRDIEDRLDDICHTLPGSLDETWHYPDRWPLTNCWLGVSAEDQATADERIPPLLDTPAAVRFVSLEPLLGAIDLARAGLEIYMRDLDKPPTTNLHWVIVGGESGPKARPMHPDWARSLRDQCTAADVPFFFKQWGAHAPYDRSRVDSQSLATPGSLDTPMRRFGKKLAGRLLDGVEWNQMPERS